MKVLVANQDLNFIRKIKDVLEKKYNITIDFSLNGIDTVKMYQENKYDYVILNDDLPLTPGFSLIEILRKKYNSFIAITTTKTELFYHKAIYEKGANDIFVQPFDFKLLGVKIYNYLSLNQKSIIQVGLIKINLDSRTLIIDNSEKTLTTKEFELLMYLIKNNGKAISREEIYKEVWHFDASCDDDRTIDTHIKMLRNELGPYKTYIETFRNFGYRFEVK